MRKLFGFFLLTIAVLLGGSCSQRYQELDMVESLVESAPELAIKKLDSLGLTGHLSLSYRARYAVLYAMALDKQSVDDGTFLPEIRKYEDYFERHGTRRDRILFHFYYGDQLLDSLKYEESAVQFMRALKLADDAEDWFFCGMSCRSIADLYALTYNSPESASYYSQACDYFRRAGKKEHLDFAALQFASALMNCGRFPEADEHILAVLAEARLEKNSLLLVEALRVSAYYQLMSGMGNSDGIISICDEIIGCGADLDSYDYAGLAKAYKQKGLVDKARACLDSSYARCLDSRAYMYSLNAEKSVLEDTGNITRRLAVSEQLLELEETLTVKALESSTVRVQKKYYEDVARLEKIKREKTVIIYTFSIVVLVLLIVLIVVLFVRYSQRKRISYEMKMLEAVRSVNEIREKIELLQKVDAGRSMDLIFLARMIDDMLKKQYSLNRNSLIQPYAEIIDKLRNDDDCRKRISSAADAVSANSVSKLTAACPTIKVSDVLLFSLLVLGFSYKSISVIMDEGEPKLYNRAKRLREKIMASGSPDTDAILSAIPKR